MSNPETPIVAYALKALPVYFPGAKLWRANSGGPSGAKSYGHKCNSINLVDIVGWQRWGMALAIEVKTETGRLSAGQYAFLQDVDTRGGYAGLFTPSGLFKFGTFPDKHMPRGKK